MYVVQETFTAKPGMASKLAMLFKATFAAAPPVAGAKTEVLTDHIGDFNTVMLVTHVPELADFEKAMKEYGDRADLRELMKGYTDMYLTGRRQIFKVM